jgi:hypothetical protein
METNRGNNFKTKGLVKFIVESHLVNFIVLLLIHTN